MMVVFGRFSGEVGAVSPPDEECCFLQHFEEQCARFQRTKITTTAMIRITTAPKITRPMQTPSHDQPDKTRQNIYSNKTFLQGLRSYKVSTLHN